MYCCENQDKKYVDRQTEFCEIKKDQVLKLVTQCSNCKKYHIDWFYKGSMYKSAVLTEYDAKKSY